ncbi:peptidoglycan-binding protein [Bacillus salipaludis]|uniref:peptidoglycan-binding protein n=1 Tax=Bacillus salipaludis TaxID=2547811 RepID=UPI003D1FE7D6
MKKVVHLLLSLTFVFGVILVLGISKTEKAEAASHITVKYGSSGSDVIYLQTKLNSLGFSAGNVDGIFGNITLTAVKNFQKSKGLNADGIVGPVTWGALENGKTPISTSTPVRQTVQLGSKGSDVRYLQTKLNSLGFSAGTVDGVFGNITLTAVKNFQKYKALMIDGIVGPATWGALENGNTPPPPPPAQTFHLTVQLGSQGSDVKYLQTKLNGLGFSAGTVDGVFDKVTLTAVKNFQKSKGLSVDGIVGPVTWSALEGNPVNTSNFPYLEQAVYAAKKNGWSPEAIYAQWQYETANFTSMAFKKDNNLAGITWNNGQYGWRKGTCRGVGCSEGGYYVHFNNFQDGVEGYIITTKEKNFSKIGTTKDPYQEALLMKQTNWGLDPGYYTGVKTHLDLNRKNGIVQQIQAIQKPSDPLQALFNQALKWESQNYFTYVQIADFPSYTYWVNRRKSDCSQFVGETFYNFLGIKLPRTTWQIYADSRGKSVSLSNLQPGDLIFMTTGGVTHNHMGIYMGNSTVIQMGVHGLARTPLSNWKVDGVKRFIGN